MGDGKGPQPVNTDVSVQPESYDRNELLEWLVLSRDFIDPETAYQALTDDEWPGPPLAAYIDEFTTLTDAYQAAGYDITIQSGRYSHHSGYTDRELIAYIQRLGKRDTVSEPPSKSAYIDSTRTPSLSPIRVLFGTWETAVIAALYDKTANKGYSDAELIDWIHQVADGDTPPSARMFRFDVDDQDAPSVATFTNRFGSWNDAIAAAGYEPREPVTAYSDAELIMYIDQLADDERPPTYEEMDTAPELPQPDTFRRHFGSWRDAVDAAGYDPEYHDPRYSHDELLADLQRLADRLDRVPVYRDLRNHEDIPSSSAYNRAFDSLAAALNEAGLKPNSPAHER